MLTVPDAFLIIIACHILLVRNSETSSWHASAVLSGSLEPLGTHSYSCFLSSRYELCVT